jgi:hypothetical protein
MMKSRDLTVGDALYLYTICPILPDSSDFLPYKESLFLWLCIEPPRHAWRRPAIQQCSQILQRSSTGKELKRGKHAGDSAIVLVFDVVKVYVMYLRYDCVINISWPMTQLAFPTVPAYTCCFIVYSTLL